MNKIADGLKQAIEDDATLTEVEVRANDGPAIDAMSVGITALRNAGLDPLRLWSLKAPKDAGGVVSAVFLQGDSRVVIMHQFPSGKFALFEKINLDDLMDRVG